MIWKQVIFMYVLTYKFVLRLHARSQLPAAYPMSNASQETLDMSSDYWMNESPCHCIGCRFLVSGVCIDSSGWGRHPGTYQHLGASLSLWEWCCWRFGPDMIPCHVQQGCSCWMFMYPSVVTTPCIKCMPLRTVSYCRWHFCYTAGSKFSSMYCARVIFLARHACLAVHGELWHALHNSQQGEVENIMQRMGNMCTPDWSVMSHSCWQSMLHIDNSVCYIIKPKFCIFLSRRTSKFSSNRHRKLQPFRETWLSRSINNISIRINNAVSSKSLSLLSPSSLSSSLRSVVDRSLLPRLVLLPLVPPHHLILHLQNGECERKPQRERCILPLQDASPPRQGWGQG